MNFVSGLREGKPSRMISGEIIKRRITTIWGKIIFIIWLDFPIVSSEVLLQRAILGQYLKAPAVYCQGENDIPYLFHLQLYLKDTALGIFISAAAPFWRGHPANDSVFDLFFQEALKHHHIASRSQAI